MSQNKTNTVGFDGIGKDSVDNVECRMCENIMGDGIEANALWNQILFESEDFVSIPSVGALVPGYMLVLPKSHAICSGALGQRQLVNYWKFSQRVRERVEQKFEKTILFEHGPAAPDTEVGCGVDHAHLHVAPIDGPILEFAEQNNPDSINWTEVSSFKAISEFHDAGEEYLFYQDHDGPLMVGTSPQINSQLFRRAMAENMGSPEKFDWNDYPMARNVQATVSELSRAEPLVGLGVAD